jgi:hypothetical protein
MKRTWKSVQGHTDTVDICVVLEEEFHNFDVAVVRSHMQGSSVVVAYSLDVNEGDFRIGAGKYQ